MRKEAPKSGDAKPITESVARAIQAALTSRWFVPATLILATGLRAANLWSIRQAPWFSHLQLDHRYYDEWAVRIASGDWLGSGVFFVDPLYAYFLAAVYGIFGHDLTAVLVVQLLLGVGTCWMTALIGRRVFGDAVGNFACLLVALFIPGIFCESLIEKTALSTFLLTLGVLLFFKGGERSSLLAGLVLGLAGLTRGNMLVFIPFGLLAMLLEPADQDQQSKAGKKTGSAGKPSAPKNRRSLKRLALFLSGALVVLAVATARNLAAGGEPVLTTSNFGQNLFIGNHTGNETGMYLPPDFVRPDPAYEEDDFRAAAQRNTGRRLGAKELSDYWSEQAQIQMGRDPARAAGLMARKFWLFWHDLEVPDNANIYLAADYSPVLGLPLFWMGAIFPFALIGAVATFASNRRARLLSSAALIYCLTVVAFFVASRFRVQIVPVLAALASAGVAWCWGVWKRREPRKMAAAAIAVLGATLFCQAMPESLRDRKEEGLAIAYNNLGALLTAAGDEEGAIAAYEKAVSRKPEAAIAALRALGELYQSQGQLQRAEQVMRKVLEYKPDSRMGREALERLHARMKTQERPADGSGSAAEQRARPVKEGGHREAMAALKAAISNGPYDEGARYRLGGLMEKHSPPEEMVAYFRETMAADPKPQTSHYFLAIGLERQGEVGQAVAALNKALEIDPAHEMSQNRLGAILERQNRLPEALARYEEAVEIHPEFKAAHENCARVLDRLSRPAEAKKHRDLALGSDPDTPKRFLYWGRYLTKQGRFESAVPELRRALEIDPRDGEARRLLDQALMESAAGGVLDSNARTAMRAILSRERPDSPVWLTAYAGDAAAVALERDLQTVFLGAGWKIRSGEAASFALKRGVFLLVADSEPQPYIRTVHEALEAGGLKPVLGTGYRSYYNEMKRKNPQWKGLDLEPDQQFVIAIGQR